jgi:hypothetical protein
VNRHGVVHVFSAMPHLGLPCCPALGWHTCRPQHAHGIAHRPPPLCFGGFRCLMHVSGFRSCIDRDLFWVLAIQDPRVAKCICFTTHLPSQSGVVPLSTSECFLARGLAPCRYPIRGRPSECAAHVSHHLVEHGTVVGRIKQDEGEPEVSPIRATEPVDSLQSSTSKVCALWRQSCSRSSPQQVRKHAKSHVIEKRSLHSFPRCESSCSVQKHDMGGSSRKRCGSKVRKQTFH